MKGRNRDFIIIALTLAAIAYLLCMTTVRQALLLAPYISNLPEVQHHYREAIVGPLIILLCVVPIIFLGFRAGYFNEEATYTALIVEGIILGLLFWPGSFLLYLHSRDLRSCRNCDYEVSGINLRTARLSDSDLVRRFGQGCAKRYQDGRGDVYARRFGLRKPNGSVTFGRTDSGHYTSVVISKEPPSDCALSTDLISSSTAKGISLDDAEEKVFEVYGPPSIEANNNLEHVLAYIDYKKSGDSMNFGIVNQRVHSISVLLVKVE